MQESPKTQAKVYTILHLQTEKPHAATGGQNEPNRTQYPKGTTIKLQLYKKAQPF